MINVWESVDAPTEARNFADLYGADGCVLVDETGEYAAAVALRGVPYNFFVDENGVVIAAGATEPDALFDATAQLLGHNDF